MTFVAKHLMTAMEEDGGGHVKHGGDEDGEELEVCRHGSVMARDGAGGEVHRAWCCRHGGVVWK